MRLVRMVVLFGSEGRGSHLLAAGDKLRPCDVGRALTEMAGLVMLYS